jgi:hypothetical protein
MRGKGSGPWDSRVESILFSLILIYLFYFFQAIGTKITANKAHYTYSVTISDTTVLPELFVTGGCTSSSLR